MNSFPPSIILMFFSSFPMVVTSSLLSAMLLLARARTTSLENWFPLTRMETRDPGSLSSDQTKSLSMSEPSETLLVIS